MHVAMIAMTALLLASLQLAAHGLGQVKDWRMAQGSPCYCDIVDYGAVADNKTLATAAIAAAIAVRPPHAHHHPTHTHAHTHTRTHTHILCFSLSGSVSASASVSRLLIFFG
jgi:hypothetical protein